MDVVSDLFASIVLVVLVDSFFLSFVGFQLARSIPFFDGGDGGGPARFLSSMSTVSFNLCPGLQLKIPAGVISSTNSLATTDPAQSPKEALYIPY